MKTVDAVEKMIDKKEIDFDIEQMYSDCVGDTMKPSDFVDKYFADLDDLHRVMIFAALLYTARKAAEQASKVTANDIINAVEKEEQQRVKDNSMLYS